MTEVELSEFLDKQITENNLFASYISRDRTFSKPVKKIDEYFTSALVCYFAPGNIPAIGLVKNTLYGRLKHGLMSFLVEGGYPPDSDTNSVVLALLYESGYEVSDYINMFWQKLKHYTVEGNIIPVWLSDERTNRIDPVVIANVLYLACLSGYDDLMSENLMYLENYLTKGYWLEGSRYYHSPDSVLFFIWRMLRKCAKEKSSVSYVLEKALLQRTGTTWHTLDLAQRVIMSKWAGIDNRVDRQRLRKKIDDSGNIEPDSLFRYGNRDAYFVSPALVYVLFYYANEI